MNKNYCTIYLVRHGETDWNVKGLVQGHTDTPLNKTGIKQAGEVAGKLSHIKFDAFYSSDLLRAKQTAEIAALNYNLAIQTTKALRERLFGNYEGKKMHFLNKFRDAVEKLTDQANRNRLYRKNSLETDEQVVQRLITFLREVAVANPNKVIFMASHGGVIRQALNRLSGKVYRSGDVANTAYLELKSDGVDFFIESMYGIKEHENH